MTVSNSNGGLGLPTEDLVDTTVCGIGVATGGDSSGGSWRGGNRERSGAVVSGSSSLSTCIASASGVVPSGSGATG